MSKIIHISSIVAKSQADKHLRNTMKYKPSSALIKSAQSIVLPKYNDESVERTPREKAIIAHCDMVAKIIVSQIMSET
jgi:hypothetical protein